MVTWAHVGPGPWRPRSPASRREPRVRRDGDRNYLDFSVMDPLYVNQWRSDPHYDLRRLYDNDNFDSPSRRDRLWELFARPQGEGLVHV